MQVHDSTEKDSLRFNLETKHITSEVSLIESLPVDLRWQICQTAGDGIRSYRRDTDAVRQPWWRAPSNRYAAVRCWPAPSAARRWRLCAHVTAHKHPSPFGIRMSPEHKPAFFTGVIVGRLGNLPPNENTRWPARVAEWSKNSGAMCNREWRAHWTGFKPQPRRIRLPKESFQIIPINIWTGR